MTKVGPLILKKRAGKPLTPGETATLKKHHKEHRERGITIYFASTADKAKAVELAHKQGMRNFSRWAVLQLERIATEGLPSRDYIDQLKKDRDQLQRFYDIEREKVTRLEKEKADLTRRLEGLAEKIAAALEREQRR